MDIYDAWLPANLYYAVHLTVWMLPVIVLQWLGFWKILWPNRRPLALAAIIVGLYLSLTDIIAVSQGVWHFDESLIMGLSLGGVPLEEWGFFLMTALLVAQSFVLFLPKSLRAS